MAHITAEKMESQRRRMASLEIFEDDIEEKFVRGSGSGGQKINKTSSCVYLHHIPSGIEVKCQRSRSQVVNRFFARRELCERIAEKRREKKSQRQQRIEKIRRQKRRRSRRQKERMLQAKHHQSKKKQRRGRVDPGTD